MTEKTNQCDKHSGLEGCANELKNEIDNKVWPAIRGMLPWKYAIVFGALIVAFGLILINTNASGITSVDTKVDTKINMLDSKYEAKFEKMQSEIDGKLDIIIERLP